MTSGTNNKSSSIATTTLILLAVLVLILGNLMYVTKGQDTTVEAYSCDDNTWGDNSAYAEIVSDVLDEVVHGAPINQEKIDYSTASSGDNVVYGYGECNEALTASECYDCLTAARYELNNFCANTVGGEIELVDCKIRYENYDFYPN